MFRLLNFILISLISWSTFAQQPIAQTKAYLSNQTLEELLFVSIKEQKLYHIKKEINENTLSLMKNIKQQFDPNNILNPDKSI